MRIAVGFDHAGFPLKERIVEELRAAGHEVLDLGTFGTDAVDYPDYAQKVGEAIQRGQAERGVLVCGSGVGAAMAADKLAGIRAGACHDSYSAHQGVEHDDMNVLCLGARVIGPELAAELVRTFVAATFSGEERHVRRVAKIKALESREEPVAGATAQPEGEP